MFKKSDDIIVTTYHSHMGASFGGPVAWGEDMAANGTNQNTMNLVIPANGYTYTGNVLMIAASGNSNAQGFVLTTDGLWSWGAVNEVVDLRTDNLGIDQMTMPTGVTPADVLDIKANSDVFFLVTKTGEVWIAGQNVTQVSGNTDTTANQWQQVETAASTPLTGIVELTGSREVVYARKADNTIWAWGRGIALGNGAVASTSTYSTQVNPAGLPGGVTLSQLGTYMDNGASSSGVLALGSDQKLYGIGYNSDGRLIDTTTNFISSWTEVSTPVGEPVLFVATSENSEEYASASIITLAGVTNNLYTWGEANRGNIGHSPDGLVEEPTSPSGFNAGVDNPVYTSVGGHAMSFADKSNNGRICFVGHITSGSGGGLQNNQNSFDCFGQNAAGWPAEVDLCFQTPPTGTISGSVKDTLGDPIAGVTVELQYIDPLTGDANGTVVKDVNGTPLTMTTLVDGTYSFSNVITDDYVIVQTDKPGYASVSDADDTVDTAGLDANVTDTHPNTNTNDNKIPVTVKKDEGNDTGNNFVDAEAGKVSGSVKDSLGNPIAGVTVEIKDAGGNVVNDAGGNSLSTTTLLDGTYSFADIPVGDYDIVQTDKPGYASVSDTASADNDTTANTNTNDNKIPVSITRDETDINNDFVDDFIPPTVTDDESLANVPGSVSTPVNLLANDTLSDGSNITNPATQVTIDLDPATAGVQNTLTVPNEGTFTVDPATGNLTFDPVDGFTSDPTDIPYTLTEVLTGLSVDANINVEYTEVLPVAANDASLGNAPGSVSTPVNLLANDTLSDGSAISNPTTQVTIDLDPTTPGVQNTLTVVNEGTFTVDPATGNLTFDPIDGFTSDPTDIPYTLTEVSTGLTIIADINVEYTEVQPVATDDESLGNAPGSVSTAVNLLANDTLSDGSAISDPAAQVMIDLDPGTAGVQNTLTVVNEGTFTVDPATGNLTFAPEIGFLGNPTDIPYTLTEVSTGLNETASINVEYSIVARDDNEIALVKGDVITVNPLANDVLVDGSTPTIADVNITMIDPITGNPTKNPIVVPNEGTWTLNNATGEITFTPEAGFNGDPTPLDYMIIDLINASTATGTISIDYPQVPVPDISSGTPGDPVTIDVLANDDTVDPTTVQIVGTINPGDPLVVPGEGTWTVDPVNGFITFTPEAGFTGDPTPIMYTATDTNGNPVVPASVTINYTQQLNDDNKSGISGTPVSLDIIANDDDINASSISFDEVSVGGVGTDTDGDGDIDQVVVDAEGTWTVDANGQVTFTPEAAFTGNPTPIQYAAKDALGNTLAPATITVNYNQSIAATDDGVITIIQYGATDITALVLGNDAFTGNVTVDILTQPQNGTVEVIYDGNGRPTILYTPNPDINYVPDEFRYSITDINGNVAAATVVLDIQCVSSQTSDNGDALGTISMFMLMFSTLMLGLYFRRKDDERGEA